jgi:hypothetical protein
VLNRGRRAHFAAWRAVSRVRRRLVGQESDGLRVSSIFHYGAVGIDTNCLVVWILLTGKPDEEIPEWLELTPDLLPTLQPISVDFDWLLSLRRQVVQEFAKSHWPNADELTICVDSSHRVQVNGGFRYFK